MFRSFFILICFTFGSTLSAEEIYDPKPKLLQGPEGDVRILVFSPSDKLLASVYDLREVIVWNVVTGRRIFEKKYGEKIVRDAATEKPFFETKKDKEVDIRWVSFSPDSELLAISTGKQIEIFEVSSGKLRHTIKNSRLGLFSPKEKIVVYTSGNKLMLHDFKKEDRVLYHDTEKESVVALSISPDGKQLLFLSSKNFYLQNLEDDSRIKLPLGETEDLAGLVFTPQSDKLVLNRLRKSVQSYDIGKGKFTQETKLDKDSEQSFFVFQAVGGKYVFGGGNWTSGVCIYELGTLKETQFIEIGKSPNSIASTSTGDLIAIGFGDSIAEKWHCNKGEIWLYSAGKGKR